MYHEANGAFTGEISAAMLLDVGCSYVILGHSERRHILGETDADVNKKTLAALAAGLVPIVCVGELLAEREAGQTAAVIRRQFDGSLAGVTAEQIERVVIAYEPVWAIGTGKVATPEQAEEVHADLRRLLAERYNERVAGKVRILYGGSVKAGNAGELLAQPNIDGALVGGASLKVDEFLGIAGASAVSASGSIELAGASPAAKTDSNSNDFGDFTMGVIFGTLADGAGDLPDPARARAARPRRRFGRRAGRHGRLERVRREGGRRVHADHDRDGRDLDLSSVRAAVYWAESSRRRGSAAACDSGTRTRRRTPCHRHRCRRPDKAAATGERRRRRADASAQPSSRTAGSSRRTSTAPKRRRPTPQISGRSYRFRRSSPALLISMTGFGEARGQADGPGRRRRSAHDQQPALQAQLSARAKVTPASSRTSRAVVREAMRRGTVQVNLRVERQASADDYRINTAVLESYRCAARSAHAAAAAGTTPSICGLLLQLPGVVDEQSRADDDPRDDWPAIEPVLQRGAGGGDQDAGRRRGGAGWPIWRSNGQQIEQFLEQSRRAGAGGRRIVSGAARRSACSKALAELNVTRRAGRPAARGEPVRRPQRHLGRNRPPAQPPAAVRRGAAARRKLRPQAGIHRPGNGPRGQHDRLEGQRRGDLAATSIEIKTALERIREQIQNVE